MKRILPLILALFFSQARCADLQWHGYLDLRVATAASERSWVDGGIGKTRYGGGGLKGGVAGAALIGTAQLAPSLLGYADLQVQTSDQTSIELIEAYLRWRPLSLTPWRWSVKAGAFFPPLSLENDAIGWTSPWTLTPSAINSWVGEELRGAGTEFRLEHRDRDNSFEMALAAFAGNDPAGEILAARGWSLGDVTHGFGGRLREPDAYGIDENVAPPLRYRPYVELDHHPGWYADFSWRSREYGRYSLMRYDNLADPTLSRTEDGHTTFAWRTKFWSFGTQRRIGPLEWIAQAMTGSTAFKPSPFFRGQTDFDAAYLLAGWASGEWRPALRVDWFALRENPAGDVPLSEHGHAITAALVWRPRSWIRVTGEVLHIDSSRPQRRLEGMPEDRSDTQCQLGARLFF